MYQRILMLAALVLAVAGCETTVVHHRPPPPPRPRPEPIVIETWHAPYLPVPKYVSRPGKLHVNPDRHGHPKNAGFVKKPKPVAKPAPVKGRPKPPPKR